MGDRSVLVDLPSHRTRLTTIRLLAFAPMGVALIAEALAQPISLSQARLGNFEANRLTMWVAVCVGLVYASVVTMLSARAARELARARARLDEASGPAEPRDDPLGGAPGVTFAASLAFCVVAMFFICGAVNRLAGSASVERALVAGVRTTSDRRCTGWRVTVHSASLPEGGTVCVGAGAVSAQATSGVLYITLYLSPLGRQIGLADPAGAGA